MRCMKITCEDEDSDSDGGDMVDNYRLGKQISWMNKILTKINKPFSFLSFISTHPPPSQASLPCWRPCCQSLQLKWSYSTQKSKIRPSLERKVFQVTSLETYSGPILRNDVHIMESFNVAPFLMHPSLNSNHLSFHNETFHNVFIWSQSLSSESSMHNFTQLQERILSCHFYSS